MKITFINYKKIFISLFLIASNIQLFAQQSDKKIDYESNRLFGITIDESSFDQEALQINNTQQIENIIGQLKIIKAAQPNNNALTVRIVLPLGCENDNNCDDAEPILTNKLGAKYIEVIKRIKSENLAKVMAQLIDSDVETSSKCFVQLDEKKSVALFLNRTKKMYEKLGDYVDIWEIGNEVNGDWFGGSVSGIAKNKQRRKIIVAQLKAAYDFLETKKIEVAIKNKNNVLQSIVPKIAITYYFSGIEQNRHSYENINDEMMSWIKGEGEHFMDNKNNTIKFTNLDYVLVSYYPDDNFYTPQGSNTPIPIVLSAKEWVDVFAIVQKNFCENTKFGLGEMGSQCYFTNKQINCNACKILLLDYDTHQKNPCDKYDADGEVSVARKCPCCYCAQIKVVADYYTDLDLQICEAIKTDSRFKSNMNFIGGYFNWYYSGDVINKFTNGNAEDRVQAEKVRSATINAFTSFIK
jgi:hypothetical protein